jgi:hypothetical protein
MPRRLIIALVGLLGMGGLLLIPSTGVASPASNSSPSHTVQMSHDQGDPGHGQKPPKCDPDDNGHGHHNGDGDDGPGRGDDHGHGHKCASP